MVPNDGDKTPVHNLEYLLDGTIALSSALSEVDPSRGYDQTVQHLLSICKTEFRTNFAELIPHEDVGSYFASSGLAPESPEAESLRNKHFFQLGDDFYVPLKNNGYINLGVIHLNGVVKRFLGQIEPIKSRILDYLGSHAGQLLVHANLFQEVKRKAEMDPKLQIYNHGKLIEAFTEWCQSLSQEQADVSVLFIDIDEFKKYNDTYGHIQGDKALIHIANIVKGLLKRETDLVARYGGEEIVALVKRSNSEQARQTAEMVRTAVESSTVDISGLNPGENLLTYGSAGTKTPDKITLSIGVASAPDCTKVYPMLISLADLALYAAKEAGRNRVVVYQPAQTEPE